MLTIDIRQAHTDTAIIRLNLQLDRQIDRQRVLLGFFLSAHDRRRLQAACAAAGLEKNRR